MDRIDLAHGSFFALHRPLLGLTNKSVEAAVAQQGHEGKSSQGSVFVMVSFLFFGI